MGNLQLFGKRVKELRKNKKLTQEQLAEIINLDPKQIGNIETGACFTTMQTLEKLAKVFEIKIVDLFMFEHQKSRSELIDDIHFMIEHASEDKIKFLHRIITDVLR